MLKIKFWRVENVVIMKILEQGDEIKRGCGVFFEHDGIKILSVGKQAMFSDEIYIRGTNTLSDELCTSIVFGSVESAKVCLEKYVKAVEAYNSTITKKTKIEQSFDVEEVIAE